MASHSTPVGHGSGESLLKRQARINDACSLLIQLGFHQGIFTINNLHSQGYTDDELRIEAYKLYEDDCTLKRILPIPKHDEMGFKKAMELFGEVVKERKLVSYLNDPVRKENIANYLNVCKFVRSSSNLLEENEVHGGTAKKMKSEFGTA